MAERDKEEAEVSDPVTGRFRQLRTSLLCSEVGKSSKHVFTAYDSETAMELAWIEYWNVPLRCINSFEANIELLKNMNHPHIVKYYDGWTDKKTKKVTVITEAMPKQSNSNVSNLKRFLTRALKMKPNVLKNWLLQILSGLHYLHTFNLNEDGRCMPFIHYDLRCDNIFIRPNTSKLKIGALEQSIFIATSHPAAFDGTPGFMPVEIYHQSKSDVKADVHAFGMAALEMFTKSMPYSECSSSLEVFVKQLQGIPPQAYARLAKEAQQDNDILLQLKLLSKCISPYEERWATNELFVHKYFHSVYRDAEFNAEGFGLDDETAQAIKEAIACSDADGELSEEQMIAKVSDIMAKTFPARGLEMPCGLVSPTQSERSFSHSMQSLLSVQTSEDVFTAARCDQQSRADRGEGSQASAENADDASSDQDQERDHHSSIKCFFPGTVHNQLHVGTTASAGKLNQECVRVYFEEVVSIDDLKRMLSQDLGVDLSECKLKYVDYEGDLVSFTSRTTIAELKKLASTIQIYPKQATDVAEQAAVSAYVPAPLSLLGADGAV